MWFPEILLRIWIAYVKQYLVHVPSILAFVSLLAQSSYGQQIPNFKESHNWYIELNYFPGKAWMNVHSNHNI